IHEGIIQNILILDKNTNVTQARAITSNITTSKQECGATTTGKNSKTEYALSDYANPSAPGLVPGFFCCAQSDQERLMGVGEGLDWP
ncbi:MAG: hypothetical protein QF565_11490, partial [Arenicellales bacterium]|nr:hypothetical protein [Arenicellales bacterium]